MASFHTDVDLDTPSTEVLQKCCKNVHMESTELYSLQFTHLSFESRPNCKKILKFLDN